MPRTGFARRGVAACLLCASSGALAPAWGQALPLSVLNGGPSAGSIPTVDDSAVATFAFPREVVDVGVATIPSGTLDGTPGANSSLTVQTAQGAGFRNRSRAVVTNALDTNVAAQLQLIANSNGNAVAASSFVFIGRSSDIGTGANQIGQSITSLLTFIGANFEGLQYFQFPFTAVGALNTNAKVTEALLNAGVDIPYLGAGGSPGIFNADPDGPGPLTGNSFRFSSSFDILCIALDTGGTPDPDVVTEFVQIRRTNIPQTIVGASTGASGARIDAVRILSRQQLVDDFTGVGGNPADTTVANLNATDDFLIASDSTGAGAQPLLAFLQNSALMPGGPYSIASITLEGAVAGNFQRVLRLDIAPDVTNASAVANLRARFLSFAPTPGGEAFAVTGGHPASAYSPLPCPGDANNSHVVDMVDLNIVLTGYGQAVPAGTLGDFDLDGLVGFFDLNVILGNFGLACSAAD